MSTTEIGTNALIAHERGLALLVVATVVESTPHIGRPPSRSFVAGVLAGSVRRDLVAADAHRLSTFGVLSHYGLEGVLGLVDALVSKGFLETIRGRTGVVCTALGRSLAEDMVWRPLGILPGAVVIDDLDLAVRAGLVEALRRHRTETAERDEVPEYRVFSETTLREIAARRPTSEDELANVAGVGPEFLVIHGATVLRLVAEHAPIVERLRAARTGATA